MLQLIPVFLYNHFIHLQIVGFLLLRNSSLFLCKRYSYFFAWFGNISLELFIVQYHIWLANDSHSKFLSRNLICRSIYFYYLFCWLATKIVRCDQRIDRRLSRYKQLRGLVPVLRLRVPLSIFERLFWGF